MDSMDFQVLTRAREWHARGHVAWLVTVGDSCSSALRLSGALPAIRGDAVLIGSVCVGWVEASRT